MDLMVDKKGIAGRGWSGSYKNTDKNRRDGAKIRSSRAGVCARRGYDSNGAKSNAKVCWAWSDQAVSGLKGSLKWLGCVLILGVSVEPWSV